MITHLCDDEFTDIFKSNLKILFCYLFESIKKKKKKTKQKVKQRKYCSQKNGNALTKEKEVEEKKGKYLDKKLLSFYKSKK